jgi:DNA-damage-inducible protein J
MLYIRVDNKIKAQATEALSSMGLSMSDAVRLLLYRIVAEQAFPLELKVPNAETRAALLEAKKIILTHQTRFTTTEELFTRLEKINTK